MIQIEWVSGNDWMTLKEGTHECERMDPFSRHMFPQTTMDEMGHMSPEQIGNSSLSNAPLIGQPSKVNDETHVSTTPSQESVFTGTCTHCSRSQWDLVFRPSTFSVAPPRHTEWKLKTWVPTLYWERLVDRFFCYSHSSIPFPQNQPRQELNP